MRFKLLVAATLCLVAASASARIREFEVQLFDSLRSRAVPLAVYAPCEGECRAVVVFSHGYGGNAPESNKAYSCLTRELARKGYFVISIQHELPGDEPLSMSGDLCKTRRPNWERGVENILFVIRRGRDLWPDLPWEEVALVGHSNGGDMTMLFATAYPDSVRRAVTLDHRRMPVPRVKRPAITSLRGCDYPPDEGVLPARSECRRLGVRVVKFRDIRHSDMDDKGSPAQHARLCREVLRALKK